MSENGKLGGKGSDDSTKSEDVFGDIGDLVDMVVGRRSPKTLYDIKILMDTIDSLRDWQRTQIVFLARITGTLDDLRVCGCGSPDCPPKLSPKAVGMLEGVLKGEYEIRKKDTPGPGPNFDTMITFGD